jgi:hypothetical protein
MKVFVSEREVCSQSLMLILKNMKIRGENKLRGVMQTKKIKLFPRE